MAGLRQRLRVRSQQGFTVIELLVVLALLAVVASLAAPGLRSFSSGQQVKAVTIDLAGDLMFARSEALKRGAAVLVTPSASGWSGGWVVSSGGDDLVTREPANTAIQISGGPAQISFNAFGRVALPAVAVRITLVAAHNAQAVRCVELDPSGRARSKAQACL